ncbi:MAG: chromate transporter [Alphaproteobacteria bacterium]|nr:chromate transporter [Alphaproteobacteria bacterium]
MSLFLLFLQFVKFGALAIGGGLMTLPLLYDTFVEQRHIFTPEAFGNLISISQITPGPVAINIATFVGYLNGGVGSAVVASLGLVCPSLIITGIALFFLNKYQNSWVIRGFFKGARLVAFVMMIYAIVLFCNMSVLSDPWPIKDILKTISTGHFVGPENYHINWLEMGVMVVALVLQRRQVPVTKLLIGAAVFGFFISFL